jgi:hypothetical protein
MDASIFASRYDLAVVALTAELVFGRLWLSSGSLAALSAMLGYCGLISVFC